MPALQVRDFPDELYERLKVAAMRDHRSIAQQTIALVEEGIRRAEASEAPAGPPACPHASPSLADLCFHIDTEDELRARAEKRARLIDEIMSDPIEGPFPTVEETLRVEWALWLRMRVEVRSCSGPALVFHGCTVSVTSVIEIGRASCRERV